ncbi:ImmA/IrrE family metallo-endopeptidase [Elizabethkingia anophelis]|uniref:ImmA/IrrE family metallo-endopeptidase n=1 Tax=Elizabethkingia anophelis TaxID=1117645 RepID=UPI0021A2BC2C|nr:ImmA/IrrE family metallo-endopeptidase [Elizabethkingia anophelis]MCT3977456.1 ImmA/IrrE family metallo-endopeptidase [Elizabethkingia anophelis]MCT4041393.1 ImmA/IrrE family metallo-endopeptidase [Elizabethkingia anophelis]
MGNSTRKGDLFEDKCFTIIEKALKNGELGIIPSMSKIYKKKKYFSPDREGDIIFDISIEVTLKKAKKPTLVYIIECKDLNKNVPVDDVEEFQSKINSLKGFQVKGVMIANGSLQKSGYNIANNKGFMFIEVNENGYDIVLEKTKKNSSDSEDIILNNIKKSIYDSFLVKSVYGLKKLSKNGINKISQNIINDFNNKSEGERYNINSFKKYLEKHHNIVFELLSNSKNELGKFIPAENKILINKSIENTNQYSFVFYHEVSHYFLHRNVLVNKNLYDMFSDSEFNYIENKYILDNPKNWIEWQANYLAGCLALPDKDLILKIIRWQQEKGIRNKGTIFLDKQKVNRDDFNDLCNYLSNYFNISKTVLKFRLLDLKILTIDPSYRQIFETSEKSIYPNDDIEETRRKSIERAKEFYKF